MSLRFWLVTLATVPTVLHAQAVRISGIVRSDQAPIPGATVRLTGGESRMTGNDGRFQFERIAPGGYVLTVTSIGYQPRSIPVVVASDTVLTVTLARAAVVLDTMRVRPRAVRLKGVAVDSATGQDILYATAILYPGGRIVGAKSGTFTFDSVDVGPVTIVVEGLEHVPASVHLDISRDTSIRIPMAIDSVAIRMMALGAKRLAGRLQAVSYPVKAVNRDAIAREVASAGAIVSRMLFENHAEVLKTASAPPEEGCYFLDDKKVSRFQYEGLDAEVLERIEVIRRPGGDAPGLNAPPRTPQMRNIGDVRMVRVYTRRYAASVPAAGQLPRIFYMKSGLGMVCK